MAVPRCAAARQQRLLGECRSPAAAARIAAAHVGDLTAVGFGGLT
eukprot:gene3790-7480_t